MSKEMRNMIDSFKKLLKENVTPKNLEIKTSNIPNSGRGLFTKIDIKKGTPISEFTGVPISDEEMEKLEGPEKHYLVAKSDGSTINVYNSDSPAIYVNDAHNTDFKNNSKIKELSDGGVWLVATKNIKAGEEIYCSYGTDYWENWSE